MLPEVAIKAQESMLDSQESRLMQESILKDINIPSSFAVLCTWTFLWLT